MARTREETVASTDARSDPPGSRTVHPRARMRFGCSFALALLLHASAAVALFTNSSPIPETLKVATVEFEIALPSPPPDPPPEPELPPAEPEPEPAPTPAATPRPKVKAPQRKPPAPPRARAKPADEKLPGPALDDAPSGTEPVLAAASEPEPNRDAVRQDGEGGSGSSAETAAPPSAPARPKAPPALVPPVALPGNAPPRYALNARLARVQGTVVVTFEVREDGRVAAARIVRGPEELHDTVLQAVSAWRFKPARRGGAPVRVRKTQSIVFRLESD